MALGTSSRDRGGDAVQSGEACAMAEDELDSFDTAWNKYMGEQAPMIQPFPDPSADGNLLNHQESIAFSRFFDNMLAQPSSPRQTARRLDEELQRLSYATQPYAASADYAPSENVHAPEYASAFGGDRAFVASQPVYGSVPFDDESNMLPAGMHKEQAPRPQQQQHNGAGTSLLAPNGLRNDLPNGPSNGLPTNGLSKPAPPFLTEPYAAAKLPKMLDARSDAPGDGPGDASDGVPAGPARYDYALGAMTPQESYATDPRLDPQFYAQMKEEAAAGLQPGAAAEGKRARSDSQPPAEKRARTQRAETQTKLNHMNSEKRRRAHIRDLFERMCSLVPRVARAAETLPKSLVLQETHNRLLELEAQNARLRGQLTASGVDTASVPPVILDHDPV